MKRMPLGTDGPQIEYSKTMGGLYMIGKVAEGRYEGNYVHSFSDKRGLYIQTENGEKIAISKTNAISIDDVTKQYPSTAKRTIMVLWNDFETSIIQLVIQDQPQSTPNLHAESIPKPTSSAPKQPISKQPAVKKDVPKTIAESKPKQNWLPIIIASCVPTILLLLVFTICLSTGILQFSTQKSSAVDQPTSNQQTSIQAPAVQSTPAQQAPKFDTALEYDYLDHTQFSQYWYDGVFKCGVDFQPGEYYILPLFSGGDMFSISNSPNNFPYTNYEDWQLINKHIFSEGQFVKVEHGAIMVPAEQVDTNNWWQYGVYLVGEDIPAGDYKIEPISDTYFTDLDHVQGAPGAYQVCENSPETTPIVYEQLFQSQMYVALKEGQYLVIVNAKLTPA